MRNNFDARITAIEREIEALKAVRVRSSAEMVTITKSTTIYPTVVGSQVTPGPGQPPVNTVTGKLMGCVEIGMVDVGFVSVAVSSGYDGRLFREYISATSGSVWTYKYWIYRGTQEDIDYCHGDSSIELAIPMELKISATSDFSVRVYQEEAQ